MLNTAQKLVISFYGKDPKPPKDYKAPHAYRGTAPKQRKSTAYGHQTGLRGAVGSLIKWRV